MTTIVQLANFYAPESGGLRTTVDELGRGYGAAGVHRVLIVPGADEGRHGSRITLRGPRLPGGNGYHVLASRRRVASALEEIKPDRIEVSDKLSLGWVGGWARARGIPTVLISHERIDAILSPRVPRRFPLRTVADLRNRQLASEFDTVVVTSRFGGDEFRRVGARNVRTIPLGVDLDTFSPGPGSDVDGVELVSVGRLSLEKRPDLAIETLRVLRARGVDARLTIAGAGPLDASLRNQAIGLPVRFLGHLGGRIEVARLLRMSDVTIAPCPVEAFGLAVLESLACATPVVTTDQGAAQELLDPDCGAAAPADPASLASAVSDVLARPRRRDAARRRAEMYPWSATVDAMLELHRCPRLVPS